MSTQIFIVRDDDFGTDLKLGGGKWTINTEDNNFGGECVYVSQPHVRLFRTDFSLARICR